jgi:hypothetical protein
MLRELFGQDGNGGTPTYEGGIRGHGISKERAMTTLTGRFFKGRGEAEGSQ